VTESPLFGFPTQLYRDAAGPVGWGCAALLFTGSAWVHRRVERIDILSAQLVRRSVSADFTVPADAAELLRLGDGGPYLVPIATLGKRPLRNFDLRDEGGATIAIVGQEHNGLVAHSALLAHAGFALRNAPSPEPSAALTETLQTIAREAPGEASAAIDGLVARAANGDEESRLVLRHQAAQVLIRDLADNYILLAVLDDVRRRRVLKYSYEEPLTLAPSTIHERLGWSPVSVSIDVPAAAGPASYHAEVVVPEAVRILETVMLDETDRLLADEGEADRAAVHAPNVLPDAQPRLEFALGLERGVLPVLGAAVAALTTLQLAAGALLIDFDALRGATPAASVLLAGSAFFAAVLARSGEHRLVQALFAGPRVLLALVALVAVMAGSGLGYDAPSGAVKTIWEIAALASAVATGMLVRTAIVARPLVPGVRAAPTEPTL
jgi:hypothetical protein